jgi:hypothetical protein
VRALSLVNILDVRQGDGTYVTSLDPRLLLEAMSFIVDFHRDDTVLEFLRVRRILEPAATAMAAERITDSESEGLRKLLDSIGPARVAAFQQADGLVGRQRVGQVAEVDQPGDLLGRHPREQQPQRLAGPAGGQVPACVEHRPGGHVHDPAGRAEPVQRAVPDQPPVQLAQAAGAARVAEDLVQVLAGQEWLEDPDRRELDLVAAADGERVAVPGQMVRVGPDDDVRRRVVRRVVLMSLPAPRRPRSAPRGRRAAR